MDRIFKFLDAGGTVVTATRRLHRSIMERYAQTQQDVGRLAWPTPVILYWEDWLTQSWLQVADHYLTQDQRLTMLLNDAQEQWLWESAVGSATRSPADLELLHVPATARAARQAWQLLREWNLTLSDFGAIINDDAKAFCDWTRAFVRGCAEHGWLTHSELVHRLRDACAAGNWSLMGPVMWLGFDELNASQQLLRDQLQAKGCSIQVVGDTGQPASACVCACQDPAHEIASAARWARALLERGETGPIGIVFRDLRPVRADVEYVFESMLHPGGVDAADSGQHRLFHLSLGEPLSRYPVIKTALLLLSYLSGPRPFADVSALLHSPFVAGGVKEGTARSTLDRYLRRLGIEHMGLRDLHRVLIRDASSSPLLADCLERATQFGVNTRRKQSPAAWAETFIGWLQVFGWPGQRALNSAEYQAVQTWRETLSRFSALGAVVPTLRLGEALAHCKRQSQERIFQPLVPPAPVQIMGMREAAGMHFTHLWLAEMSDDQWPPAPRPNPFVPHALQRRRGLPDASAARVLEWAERVTDRLLCSADRVVVSYPEQRQQQPLKLSPLFRDVPVVELSSLALSDFAGYVAQLQHPRPRLERVADDRGPVLRADESLSGGVSILRDQAACPFRAFAQHRLGLESLADVEPGLSAADRGSIVHRCLAGFWSSMADQATLLALSDAELAQRIADEVDIVLAQLPTTDDARFQRSFLTLERQRLIALLTEWLEVERRRPPFRVVATEQKTGLTIAGLETQVRADRIDVCEQGRMVIDYKTGGQLRLDGWFDDRPDDPQLPIYLLCATDVIDALAFARVRRGECTLKGLGNRPIGAEVEAFVDSKYGEGRTWGEQCQDWRSVMETLAANFCAGHAAVDPKTPNACQHCEAWPVCRIFEDHSSGYSDDGDA